MFPELAALIGDATKVFEMEDDSMEPLIKPGFRVLGAMLKNPHILYWGWVYVIVDANDLARIRRAYEVTGDKNSILLVSENSNKYPPTKISFNDIQSVYAVNAVLYKLNG